MFHRDERLRKKKEGYRDAMLTEEPRRRIIPNAIKEESRIRRRNAQAKKS